MSSTLGQHSYMVAGANARTHASEHIQMHAEICTHTPSILIRACTRTDARTHRHTLTHTRARAHTDESVFLGPVHCLQMCTFGGGRGGAGLFRLKSSGLPLNAFLLPFSRDVSAPPDVDCRLWSAAVTTRSGSICFPFYFNKNNTFNIIDVALSTSS